MEKNFYTDNKSFMIYKDWEKFLKMLDNTSQMGELFMALFAYASRGEEPDFKGALAMAFEMMKDSILRDGKKWEEVADRRAKGGSKGGRPKNNENTKMDFLCEKPQGFSDNHKKPQAPDTVTETVTETDKETDTDTVTETDKETDKETDIETEKDTDTVTETDTVTDTDTDTEGNDVPKAFGGYCNVMLSQNEYDSLVSLSDGLSLKRYIDNLSSWLHDNNKQCRNPYQTIKNWIKDDTSKENAEHRSVGRSEKHKTVNENTSYDLDEWEREAMSRNPLELLLKKETAQQP